MTATFAGSCRHGKPVYGLRGSACLPITAEIMAEACSLPPPIHRDPADRVLIATARHERLTLVTKDGKIIGYPHVATVA